MITWLITFLLPLKVQMYTSTASPHIWLLVWLKTCLHNLYLQPLYNLNSIQPVFFFLKIWGQWSVNLGFIPDPVGVYMRLPGCGRTLFSCFLTVQLFSCSKPLPWPWPLSSFLRLTHFLPGLCSLKFGSPLTQLPVLLLLTLKNLPSRWSNK